MRGEEGDRGGGEGVYSGGGGKEGGRFGVLWVEGWEWWRVRNKIWMRRGGARLRNGMVGLWLDVVLFRDTCNEDE